MSAERTAVEGIAVEAVVVVVAVEETAAERTSAAGTAAAGATAAETTPAGTSAAEPSAAGPPVVELLPSGAVAVETTPVGATAVEVLAAAAASVEAPGEAAGTAGRSDGETPASGPGRSRAGRHPPGAAPASPGSRTPAGPCRSIQERTNRNTLHMLPTLAYRRDVFSYRRHQDAARTHSVPPKSCLFFSAASLAVGTTTTTRYPQELASCFPPPLFFHFPFKHVVPIAGGRSACACVRATCPDVSRLPSPSPNIPSPSLQSAYTCVVYMY